MHSPWKITLQCEDFDPHTQFKGLQAALSFLQEIISSSAFRNRLLSVSSCTSGENN